MAVEFYRTLFRNEVVEEEDAETVSTFPMLEDDSVRWLGAAISREVKEVVFSIEALKAPGVDWYSAIFFHKEWDVVGKEVWRYMEKVWRGEEDMRKINETLKRWGKYGDPLSPYIFVLGMEKLTHIIQDARREGRRKTIKVGKEGPEIAHLMFADDLIIFGEAS